MRLGILLILLQSMLLCAEGRAEPFAVQLDGADKQISALQLTGDGDQSDDNGVALLPATPAELPLPDAAYTPGVATGTFLSPVRAAHTIRGPPARQ